MASVWEVVTLCNKAAYCGQWRSNRGFRRFKDPGPSTVRGPDRESRGTSRSVNK